MLALLALGAHHQARWLVRELDCGRQLVPCLTSGATAKAGLEGQVGRWDYQIPCLGDRKYGNSDGRGVGPPSFFSGRDALPAVASGLVAEDFLDAGTLGPENENARTFIDDT
jgi:hypothetical protein